MKIYVMETKKKKKCEDIKERLYGYVSLSDLKK